MVTYEHILFNNNKVQVDSALRDGNGLRIDTGYVVHAEYTLTVSTSQQYHKPFTDLNLGSYPSGGSTVARIPRLVEIYDANGSEINTDVKIDLTNSRITIYPTAVSPSQTWTVRVTAW